MRSESVICSVKVFQRNAALDVLRFLLIYGVVLTHTLAFCHYERLPWCAVTDCLTHPAVLLLVCIGLDSIRCLVLGWVRPALWSLMALECWATDNRMGL